MPAPRMTAARRHARTSPRPAPMLKSIELPVGSRFTGFHFVECLANDLGRGLDTLSGYRPLPAVPKVGNAVRTRDLNVLTHSELAGPLRAQEPGRTRARPGRARLGRAERVRPEPG